MKRINIPHNYKAFLVTLSIVAVIAGSLFYFKLNQNNQEVIKTYIQSYFLFNDYNSFFNILIFNLILFLLIWVLGLSMFGSILIAFLYFTKLFLLSTSVAAIISLDEKNSVLKAFLYIFPNQIISIFIYALVAIYAINFSFLFSQILFKRKELEFKQVFKNYNKIFGILFLLLIVVLIYQVYLNPLIFKLFIK